MLSLPPLPLPLSFILGWIPSILHVNTILGYFCLFLTKSSVSKEGNEKFRKAKDDRKKASSALLHWGDVYRLGALPNFHKAPKINENFSR